MVIQPIMAPFAAAATKPGPFTTTPFGAITGMNNDDHLGFVNHVGSLLGASNPSEYGSTQPGFSGMDVGPAAGAGLSIASLAGGPIGMAAGLANLGLHGYNLGQTNNALNESGLQPLGFGQTIGAMLGLNGYANGSNAGLQSAIAAQGGNTQSAGSPGFSIGAASGADQGQSGGGFSPGAASGNDGNS